MSERIRVIQPNPNPFAPSAQPPQITPTQPTNFATQPKKAGRDHHHTAFSMLLAGGGVKGGTVYGASDELGMHATENPV
ncbi:MAG: hypothetical protein JWM16_5188, partial [Verrucomicrobiales bacterium]|nr:hypothetical protein [Verrucomicrobiales bacterium]